MSFVRDYHNKSGTSDINTRSNEIGMNVVIDDGVFQGSCDISQVKQELSDLENIIMEGDIILKVHADGENDDISHKGFQVLTGECAEHANLNIYEDPTLIKVGDSFQSNKDFVKYVNDNAKTWCYYYKCTEAQNADTENEEYTYCCVYLRNRDYTKKKGSKKRYNCKTDCPCKVKLRRRPDEPLTVVYVCNHHDHDLSKEDFNKLQHNKKLPPYIKEIIMDLLSLEVEIAKIRKFVEMETGVKMSLTFFYEIDRKMKLKNEERQISDKRLKELSDKMSVVDEMYSCDEDDNTDDQTHSFKSKRVKVSKVSTHGGIICKFEKDEDMAAANNLEASMSMDTQGKSWMSDQSVAPPNRTSTSEWDVATLTAVTEPTHMETEIDSQDFNDTDHAFVDPDYTDEYTVEETTQETTNTETDNTDENNFSQFQTVVIQDEFGNIINCENDEQIVILQQDENGVVQGENGAIGYFDGEQIIYMTDPNQQNQEANEQTEQVEQVEQNNSNDGSTACDAAVQTSNNPKPGHSFVPVFDVYMKNGNVTGFVVNDNVAQGEQNQSAEKDSKELQDTGANTSQQSARTPEPICDISTTSATQEYVCGDTYTKHEYIHRYNIDHYMANPHFPKYIDTLAKKTRTDVMHMLARVYNEKAMFKMTTTQKEKEGNTKIWYLTDVRRKGKYKMSDEEKRKRDKIGQYLTDILILKERVKSLKKENDELITRNKYLEEVALRLAKMNEHN